jgi:pyruvate kinase
MKQLESLRSEMRRRHGEYASVFERVRLGHRQSAANLIDYLTLRQYDLRDIQDSLAELGLSSLGRTEEHVITTLERVIDNLHMMTGDGDPRRTESAVSFWQGRAILQANTLALLGPLRSGRSTRILVTMPSEAADDYQLVANLIEKGMDCARINCAHDGPEQWERMASNIRRAAQEMGRPCPILMDLPGPKLRTGPVEPGPRVVRLRPLRDALGRTRSPASVLLVDADKTSPDAGLRVSGTIEIPVPAEWLAGLAVGDQIRLRDTRDSPRTLEVARIDDAGVWIEVADTTYLGTGTTLTTANHRAATVGSLPALEQAIVIRVDDTLTLTADLTPAASNEYGGTGFSPGTAEQGRSPTILRIGCTMPQVFGSLQVDDRVFFDDGKIGGVVIAARPTEADIRITMASPRGSKLRAEKGINVPDSGLRLPAIGPDDERILPFVVGHADLVELSFAQSSSDVASLQSHLGELGGDGIGIVLKIETVRGFVALPEMLLAAMASERIGVMVARGDLAVECGFERLAEVQEEMLWLCDAAHVPVIWATQVLDQMAKTGQPSRAEVSDAAMAGRAECVMLNKGPFIAEAVGALDDIISRMSSHQLKKMNLLRRLASWKLAPSGERIEGSPSENPQVEQFH